MSTSIKLSIVVFLLVIANSMAFYKIVAASQVPLYSATELHSDVGEKSHTLSYKSSSKQHSRISRR